MVLPITTCAGAVIALGTAKSVRPDRCVAALASIGPISSGAGSRSQCPATAPPAAVRANHSASTGPSADSGCQVEDRPDRSAPVTRWITTGSSSTTRKIRAPCISAMVVASAPAFSPIRIMSTSPPGAAA